MVVVLAQGSSVCVCTRGGLQEWLEGGSVLLKVKVVVVVCVELVDANAIAVIP